MTEIGHDWIKDNDSLEHVVFDLATLIEVGNRWLSENDRLVTIFFDGLPRSTFVENGWMEGCAHLLDIMHGDVPWFGIMHCR